MDYVRIRQQIEKLRDAYAKVVKENDLKFIIDQPAAEQDVEAIEAELGLRLPYELRDFLLNFSGHCEFMACLPDDFNLPYELRQIFSAEFVIATDSVLDAEDRRREWVEDCFGNQADEYDRVWHNKLGIMTVANGDVIALDIGIDKENPPVVYLSHDDGEGHGYILGKTFGEYIENLILIGACGNEDWQVLPFCPNAESGIDPNCENAVKYRQLIGLECE